MIKVLNSAKDSVTFDMVRGWYQRIFTEIFPDREVPVYLRADTSDSKFKNEVKRQRNEYVEGEKSKHKTRSGGNK